MKVLRALCRKRAELGLRCAVILPWWAWGGPIGSISLACPVLRRVFRSKADTIDAGAPGRPRYRGSDRAPALEGWPVIVRPGK